MTTAQDHALQRTIARDEIATAFAQHLTLCPLTQQHIPERVRELEHRVSLMWGYMVGAGVISGGTLWGLDRLLP